MAALDVWDDSPLPWWSQLRRRLRDDPGVWSLLARALAEHPATSGRLAGLRPLRPARPSFSTWLTGTWHPDGTDVLVKVNATPRERFWMSAASRGAPGSVPPVFASDDALGPVDASWLVLERLPYTYDPGWGAAAFSSLLAAAARFQVFAAAVDTDLVFDEDVETIRRFTLAGQDLCPEAATVVSHLDGDWAWAEATAPREVLFGDLHFGNAAFRSPPPDLAALLYDPVPRREPWPFEPAYREVLCDGSGLVREMAAIRRAQGRAVSEPDEVDRLSALFCGWLALAFWAMLLDWHADPAQRARLAQYVSAAAHLDRLRQMVAMIVSICSIDSAGVVGVCRGIASARSPSSRKLSWRRHCSGEFWSVASLTLLIIQNATTMSLASHSGRNAPASLARWNSRSNSGFP